MSLTMLQYVSWLTGLTHLKELILIVYLSKAPNILKYVKNKSKSKESVTAGFLFFN